MFDDTGSSLSSSYRFKLVIPAKAGIQLCRQQHQRMNDEAVPFEPFATPMMSLVEMLSVTTVVWTIAGFRLDQLRC